MTSAGARLIRDTAKKPAHNTASTKISHHAPSPRKSIPLKDLSNRKVSTIKSTKKAPTLNTRVSFGDSVINNLSIGINGKMAIKT